MKVLHKGTIPAKAVWEGSCRACESIVRAEQRELTVISDRDGPFGKAVCPVCANEMFFYPVKKEKK